MTVTKSDLLAAILPHVVFDGWNFNSFNAACDDIGVSRSDAARICPRSAADLAMAFHTDGDAQMRTIVKDQLATEMRFRDRVQQAVLARLQVAGEHKEVVRRGLVFFALPQNSADGAKLLWGTADAIWTAIGDTSQDINWYTKRLTLSGVYASTMLIWLGDDDPEMAQTKQFLDRRIEDVMQFERFKSKFASNPVGKVFNATLGDWIAKVKAPSDMPGSWRRET
jgi:ubiquinone biosynthesis protein COQ9